MKAILEFELPEDREALERAWEGEDWAGVVWEMDNYLRGEIKYSSDGYSKEELTLLERVRGVLWTYIKDRGLEL